MTATSRGTWRSPRDRQAEEVLGRTWFQRKPVEKLKPSHVVHDLELADFALGLLPRRKEQYQPKVKGKPAGPPVTVEVPYMTTRCRWYHASVYRRLTVLEGRKDEYGRFTEKPEIALAYDEEAERRRQQGVLGKLKRLVGGTE